MTPRMAPGLCKSVLFVCVSGPQSSLLLSRETLPAQRIGRQGMTSGLGICPGNLVTGYSWPPGPCCQAQARLSAPRPPSWGTIPLSLSKDKVATTEASWGSGLG